jgi:hypothetical protein
MADQVVITEKTSQAKDVRAAVGSRFGDILPAEGHLIDLLEPEDVVPEWKRWSPILANASPRFAKHDVGGDRPLKIPYGNKEAALALGARYGAGGWYAPPGVDLSVFQEKGWL